MDEVPVLEFIYKNSPIRQKELVEEADRVPGTIKRIIADLQGKDLFDE